MRKLRLTNFTGPDKSSPRKIQKLYSTGMNGKLYYKKSEKAMLEFLIQASQFLNENLKESNLVNAELYSVYRIVWMYTDQHILIDKKIRQLFDDSDIFFQRLIHNTSGPNGNYYAFDFMAKLINTHIQICKQLKDILVIIREDSIKNQVVLYEKRLQLQLEKILSYPD